MRGATSLERGSSRLGAAKGPSYGPGPPVSNGVRRPGGRSGGLVGGRGPGVGGKTGPLRPINSARGAATLALLALLEIGLGLRLSLLGFLLGLLPAGVLGGLGLLAL